MVLIHDELWRIINEIEQALGPDVPADSHITFISRQDHVLTIIVLANEPTLLYLVSNTLDTIVVWHISITCYTVFEN